MSVRSNKICKKLFGTECDGLKTKVAKLGPFYRAEEYHQKCVLVSFARGDHHHRVPFGFVGNTLVTAFPPMQVL